MGQKGYSFLGVASVGKSMLLPALITILKGSDFCEQEPGESDELHNLLEKLRDDIWFLIEYPYIDKHYRDTYYTYYSSKFRKVGRNCIRIHIFEGEMEENSLSNKDNGLDKKYLGFFIIRPLPLYILGRSLISPKAFQGIHNKTLNFVCCLMKDKISLLGREFIVHGFPHIAQDTETHTCAESALWSYIEYYGSKYSQYRRLLPSEIIKKLMDNTERQLLPSKGLADRELARCLQNNGFQCKIYSPLTQKLSLFVILQIYIESGMPLLLVLVNKNNAHAALAIGHEENNALYDSIKNHILLKKSAWIDISFCKKRLVLIDDNMPPYQIVDLFRPTESYTKQEVRDMRITSFIAPLPVHMFLVAEKAYALAKKIFNHDKIGLQAIGGKWITRLLLTGSHSFKDFIFNKCDGIMPDKLKKYLLLLSLPRFIWICEVYRIQEFVKDGYCSGLLIIDATSDGKSLASVLWYTLDEHMFMHDNVDWYPESEPIKPFRMNTYRNNLKGEWNEWKSGK